MQSSKLVIGQSEVVLEVKHLIEGENVCIIGIYGPGGIGKTTLLYTINNDVEETRGFDIVIFVVVIQTVNIINVQTTIMRKLGLYQSGNEIENQQKIFKALSQKRFMILLDDIWKYLNCEEIGIPLIHIKKKKFQDNFHYPTRRFSWANGCAEGKSQDHGAPWCMAAF